MSSSVENGNGSDDRQWLSVAHFTYRRRALRTKAITNSRINEVFEPASGSEDFIINLVDDTQDVEEIIIPPSAPLSREGWSAQLYNAQGVAFDQVDRLFDGDPDTYVDQYQNAGMPITLEIDLGSVQKVGSFSFQKRPGYSDPVYGINGTMGEYKLYVSEDGEVWEEAGAGELQKKTTTCMRKTACIMSETSSMAISIRSIRRVMCASTR